MIDGIIRDMRARSGDLRGIGARVRFVLGDDTILMDARQNPVSVETADGAGADEADCTIRMAPEHFRKMLDGQLGPMMAFTLGRLKVEGSMGIALKLAQALDD